MDDPSQHPRATPEAPRSSPRSRRLRRIALPWLQFFILVASSIAAIFWCLHFFMVQPLTAENGRLRDSNRQVVEISEQRILQLREQMQSFALLSPTNAAPMPSSMNQPSTPADAILSDIKSMFAETRNALLSEQERRKSADDAVTELRNESAYLRNEWISQLAQIEARFQRQAALLVSAHAQSQSNGAVTPHGLGDEWTQWADEMKKKREQLEAGAPPDAQWQAYRSAIHTDHARRAEEKRIAKTARSTFSQLYEDLITEMTQCVRATSALLSSPPTIRAPSRIEAASMPIVPASIAFPDEMKWTVTPDHPTAESLMGQVWIQLEHMGSALLIAQLHMARLETGGTFVVTFQKQPHDFFADLAGNHKFEDCSRVSRDIFKRIAEFQEAYSRYILEDPKE